jgi:acyl-CoA synthetase (AMP-forming)/AMP-acid ligase II
MSFRRQIKSFKRLFDKTLPVIAFPALMEVLPELQKDCDNFQCFRSRTGTALPDSVRSNLDGSIDLDSSLKEVSDDPEPESIRKSIHVTDSLLYIYTSGTTGLPKAVIIKHIR